MNYARGILPEEGKNRRNSSRIQAMCAVHSQQIRPGVLAALLRGCRGSIREKNSVQAGYPLVTLPERYFFKERNEYDW